MLIYQAEKTLVLGMWKMHSLGKLMAGKLESRMAEKKHGLSHFHGYADH
jgi:hypothetical protein